MGKYVALRAQSAGLRAACDGCSSVTITFLDDSFFVNSVLL